MAWIKMAGSQTIINTNFIVRGEVGGRETSCQVVLTDSLGKEHRGAFCQSFSQAEEALRKFLEAVVEDEGGLDEAITLYDRRGSHTT
ncbi:MAG: hypothetical protein ABSG46_20510 [Candidatus Binataceae bacterium]|jgi:hypothetical protein